MGYAEYCDEGETSGGKSGIFRLGRGATFIKSVRKYAITRGYGVRKWPFFINSTIACTVVWKRAKFSRPSSVDLDL